MKLAILIPTLPETRNINLLQRLRDRIDKQVEKYPDVRITINDAPRSMPTGTKRNQLISISGASEYFCFIDDDDMVSHNYVSLIMEAIEKSPDVITFNGWMTTDGNRRQDFEIRLGEKYEERNGKFYRYPNHLCVYKREKVSHVKFPATWQQEDYIWATEIKNKGLLKTEVHIDQDLYWYDFQSNKTDKPNTGLKVRETRLNRRYRYR
jgi:hypothetical protein